MDNILSKEDMEEYRNNIFKGRILSPDLTDNSFIHHTAIIYPNVKLGKNIYIGCYSIIGGPPEHRDFWDKEYKSVVIGDNTRISNHVTIDAGTTQDTIIGKNCILLAHSHIGHDCMVSDNVTISCGALVGGHCVIEASCNLGLNSVIHQKITIPQGVMIGASAFVGKTLKMEPYRKYAGVPARDIGTNLIK